MKAYLASLAVGVLAGLLYGLLGVRSPAPPVIALVGLLGLLIGEQLPTLIRHVAADPARPWSSWREQAAPHMFGRLPDCRPRANAAADDSHHPQPRS